MGTLAIRVWAGGVLASAKRPERLTMFTTGTDIDNEMRRAAAVHRALGNEFGTPAQTALRFALGNRDLSTVVLGIGEYDQLDEALEAVRLGPLPEAAISKLETLWATDFK